jgi:hypothetical protein
MDISEAVPAIAAPPKAASHWSTWISRVLVESALIVFSVLFALAVDEWRDDRRQASRARQAAEAILVELRNNRSSAARAETFHRSINAKLQEVAARNETPSRELAYGGLFNPARVIGTAWASARETGALDQWPYALLLRVSRVYERQARYEALSTAVASDIYVDLRRRGAEQVFRDGYAGFIGLTHDFANREGELLRDYDEVTQALETSAR